MNADQLAEVEVTLREAMKNLRRVDSESGTTFVGSIEVEGREAVAGMLLDHSFPLQLPVVALEPWDTLGFLPHISPKGNVCYLDSEGMILDGSRPGAIVADALDRSIKLLSGGIKGENLSDFVDEFDAYWSYLPDPLVAWSVLDVGTDVCEIVLAIEEGRPDYIGKAEQQIESFIHSDGYEHTLSYQKALYLPLEPNTMLIPPRFDRPLWTAYETRKIAMSHLSEENRMRLRSLTRRRPRAEETVVFSLPRPSGGHSVFGLRFAGLGRHHPLHENGVAHEVRPVRSSRVDRDFMAGVSAGLQVDRVPA